MWTELPAKTGEFLEYKPNLAGELLIFKTVNVCCVGRVLGTQDLLTMKRQKIGREFRTQLRLYRQLL